MSVCLSFLLSVCLSLCVIHVLSACHMHVHGSVHLPFCTLLLLLLLLGYVRWCSILITVTIPDGVYTVVFVLILGLLLIVPGRVLRPLWFLVGILLYVSSGNIFSSSASLLDTVEVSDTYMYICALAHLSCTLSPSLPLLPYPLSNPLFLKPTSYIITVKSIN